ncbi:MAG: HhH-GPD-type base excision DNA repair protein [Acidimicrobiales bacterium]
MKGTFAITGDPDADHLLNTDPFALLIGMLLDQQIPMERAFHSPFELRDRLGGTLDPETISGIDPDAFAKLFAQRPALHRFPGSMAKRVQGLAQMIVDDYGGCADRVWTEAADGGDLARRLRGLPGFGTEKARIFTALLAKRFGVRPKGWAEAAGPFADNTPRSVADISSRAAFDQVRAWKKEQKAKGKGKAD